MLKCNEKWKSVVLGFRIWVDLGYLKEVLEDFNVTSKAGEMDAGVASIKFELSFAVLVEILQDFLVTISNCKQDWGPANW